MGVCVSKPSSTTVVAVPPIQGAPPPSEPPPPSVDSGNRSNERREGEKIHFELEVAKKSPYFPVFSPSPAHYLFSKKSPLRSPANVSSNSTPKRFFRKPFPPPSPAKHIMAVLARRHGSVKPNEASIPEGNDIEGPGLDKSFGFSKHFRNKYELGEEVGKGHFGHTCRATVKKGELKGKQVAVKVIPKAKVCYLFPLFQPNFCSSLCIIILPFMFTGRRVDHLLILIFRRLC